LTSAPFLTYVQHHNMMFENTEHSSDSLDWIGYEDDPPM
jgi:hypothetical protein